jgi:hypothetical protein
MWSKPGINPTNIEILKPMKTELQLYLVSSFIPQEPTRDLN